MDNVNIGITALDLYSKLKTKLKYHISGVFNRIFIGVAQIFTNERKLEAETRALQSQSAKFAKQTQQWLQLVDNFNIALKVIRI